MKDKTKVEFKKQYLNDKEQTCKYPKECSQSNCPFHCELPFDSCDYEKVI